MILIIIFTTRLMPQHLSKINQWTNRMSLSVTKRNTAEMIFHHKHLVDGNQETVDITGQHSAKRLHFERRVQTAHIKMYLLQLINY